MSETGKISLPDKRYFRIGEVAGLTGLKPHVLRYWETEFKQVKPQKTRSNQRLYRKKDVETILLIKHLLYDQKYTIAGAKTRLDGKKQDPPKEEAPKQLKIQFEGLDESAAVKEVADKLRKVKRLLDKGRYPE